MKKKLLIYILPALILFGCSVAEKPSCETLPSEVEEFSTEASAVLSENPTVEYSTGITEKPATLEEVKEAQQEFFNQKPGGMFERITTATKYLPEDLANIFYIGQIRYTTEVSEKFATRIQTIGSDGKRKIELGIIKECANPEYYALQAISIYATMLTDFKPYETEEFLYAWEQEHEKDFFEEEQKPSPSTDFERYFASICLQDPAYEYNLEHAPLLTGYVEDYIDNFELYCNMDASNHTCKHDDRKYNSLEMRLNWVKATLPEEVRSAIAKSGLEFKIIDRSQELVDAAAGREFMGLYCSVGSLARTSYEGTDHPVIFLVKDYADCFEYTVLHEIGHFVADHSSYSALDEMDRYLIANPEKVAYFSFTTEYIQESVSEYFANAFAYYYCDMCDVSKYWEHFCPELNIIVENAVSALKKESTEN